MQQPQGHLRQESLGGEARFRQPGLAPFTRALP